ncbi:MAG: ATP-binding cassette domain-containing protein [Thermoplasmatales archaeon]
MKYAVKISNLFWRFPNVTGIRKDYALKNINISIKKGETYGITGPTGSGKTTLCYFIAGILPREIKIPEVETSPYISGSISIMGKKSLWISKKDGRQELVASDLPTKNVCFVRQDIESHFSEVPTIIQLKENLLKRGIKRKEAENSISHALALVRIDPNSEKILNVPPSKLSAGERQRLALAGCIAMKPEILILDEPTSDLDPASREQVIEAISSLKKDSDITIILVEQDKEVLRKLADRVAIMNNGEVIAEGIPEDLFSREELLYYFQSPELTEIIGSGSNLEERIRTVNAKGFRVQRSRREKGEVVLKTDNVVYKYEDGTKAIDGITIKIRKGEFLALVGANGSGKSTLSKLISGKLSGWSGNIIINGNSVLVNRQLFSLVGYVYQNPDQQVLGGKVIDVVLSGFSREKGEAITKEMAIEVLSKVNLKDKAMEDINSLSRGEKRRLAIASVLASNPEILIVDEPATGQDYKGASEIMDLLTELNGRGVTILFITHDMRLVAEYSRRVIVMKKGKVVFDGTPEKLFQDDALMKESSLIPPQLVTMSKKLRDSGIIDGILLNAREWLELFKFESEKKKFEAMKFPELKKYARELASKILSKYGRPEGIIYIERGGMVLGRLLSDFLSVRQVYPLKASYYTDDGIPMAHVHVGPFDYSLSDNNGYFLLVDDIADTGKTLKASFEMLKGKVNKRIVTATLVYKPQSIFKPDIFAYTVDNNTWIVFDYEETETVRRFMRKGNKEGLKFMRENF